MEGESEEAVRRKIATEYQNEGLWSTTSSGKDNKQGRGGGAAEGDDDDDPLDAFMAGIEVKCECVCVCTQAYFWYRVVICIPCTKNQIKKQKDEGETAKKEKQ